MYICYAVTSCTHFTSYSLLNLMHEIVCEFGLAIQDYIFYDFDTKYVQGLKIWGVKSVKILFLKFWVENKCFLKTFVLILMHFIDEIIWVEVFLHNLP